MVICSNENNLLIKFLDEDLDKISGVYEKDWYVKEKFGYTDIDYVLCLSKLDNTTFDFISELNIPFKINFYINIFDVDVDKSLKLLDSYRNSNLDKVVEIHYSLNSNFDDNVFELVNLCKLLRIYNIPLRINCYGNFNESDVWYKVIKGTLPNLDLKIIEKSFENIENDIVYKKKIKVQ